jgi:hypothetical protein
MQQLSEKKKTRATTAYDIYSDLYGIDEESEVSIVASAGDEDGINGVIVFATLSTLPPFPRLLHPYP